MTFRFVSAVHRMLLLLAAASPTFGADSPANAGDDAPRAVATYECVGLYWKLAQAGACHVRYRAANSPGWREALDLVYDPRDGEYRGSIVALQPDTAYEVEMTAGGQTGRLEFRTRSDRFPIGKTTIVPAGEHSAPIVIRESGTAQGYHLVTVAPGTRCTIELRATAGVGVDVNADFVIVRGLEIRNAAQHGILIRENRHDVVIEQCHIIHWGVGGGAVSFGDTGNMHSGIMADRGTRNLTLQRNLIEHPRGASNDWRTGHPSGPQGISISTSQGGNVVRYNEIWSSDSHAFNDGIGGGPNFSDTGNMNRDSDIYGNIVRNVWDDALEIEGANMNVRIWGNYLHEFFVGIATAATSKGPLYIFRNVAGTSRRSDESRLGGTMIKTGERDSFGGGRRFVFHNTVLQPNGVLNIFQAPTPNCVARNNVFDCAGRLLPAGAEKDAPSDFDYDFFSGPDRGVAQERHGVKDAARTAPLFIASYALEFYPASTTMRVVGGKVPVRFVEKERIVTDPVLQIRNPLIDAGERLPNFSDDFTGQAPDLGAFEVGRPPLQFGRRAYLRHDEGWAAWER